MHTCPSGDQEFAEAEMNTVIGFDSTVIGIDPAHSCSQMHVDIALQVKRLVMNQNFRVTRK